MNKNKNSKPFECQIWFSPQWRMSSRQSKISMSKQMEIQTRSWYALCSVPLSPGSPNKRRAIMRTTTRSTLPRAATLRPRSSLTGSWARPPAGGQAAVSLSSYVFPSTVSDWDAWYFQASGSCQCLVEDHTYLLYNFGIFPFYDFWDFGCHTELDVNGLAPKISNLRKYSNLILTCLVMCVWRRGISEADYHHKGPSLPLGFPRNAPLP